LEVGDLVVILHLIEHFGVVAETGEVGIITKIFEFGEKDTYMFDCKVRLKCGSDLQCWFGELYRIDPDEK
jgi:hypothetical protein